MSQLPTKSSHPPTAEQQAIILAGKTSTKSLMVNAYAGTGKTTTMVMLANALEGDEPVLALAFNKTIAETLEKVLPKHFTVKTFNGLGHGAWGKALGQRLTLDERKLGRLVTTYFKSVGFEASSEDWFAVRALVEQAYTTGLVHSDFSHVKGLIPDEPDSWKAFALDLSIEPKFIQAARQVLLASTKESFQGVITFDDQIYMSVFFGGVYPRFPKTIVDEAQDLSPLNHLQIRKVSANPEARLFVVGDRKQAIYAFRGADTSSMDKLKALKPEWEELPLFTTFRCPKLIVDRAQAHAPGYKAHEKNPEGQIVYLPKAKSEPVPVDPSRSVPGKAVDTFKADGDDMPTWNWSEVQAYGTEIAVLCRNNAPLLSMAFKLLRRGIWVKMLGRDIGKGLSSLAKKILGDPTLPVADCVNAINHWRQMELAKAEVMGKEMKLDLIHDKAESLLAVCEFAMPKNAKELFDCIESLFSRTAGQVVLSSGHKAKGLEWDVVLHLDRWRIPSKYAKSKEELAQEANLRYVIETRPKQVLLLADLESFS
jgi:DNA helicase-2/ATP-dependent DNA helicase PcrA